MKMKPSKIESPKAKVNLPPEGTRIQDLTSEQLQAIGYQQFKLLQQTQNNIQMIEQELNLRAQQQNGVPKPKEAEA